MAQKSASFTDAASPAIFSVRAAGRAGFDVSSGSRPQTSSMRVADIAENGKCLPSSCFRPATIVGADTPRHWCQQQPVKRQMLQYVTKRHQGVIEAFIANLP